jgi:transposase
LGAASKAVVSSLKHPLQQFIKEGNTLEEKLFILVKASHQYLCTRLKKIPDIGRKTAIMRIVLTGGFERF